MTIRVCDAQGACGTDDITVRVGISQKVVPVLQCVTDRRPAGPRYRAVFGYNNPAPFPVAAITVPFVENWFNPLPALRGQPQVFLPGNQRNVFTADFNSGTLSWTLRAPRCRPGPTPPAADRRVAPLRITHGRPP